MFKGREGPEIPTAVRQGLKALKLIKAPNHSDNSVEAELERNEIVAWSGRNANDSTVLYFPKNPNCTNGSQR